jgi:PAS domain S-box-containing protein
MISAKWQTSFASRYLVAFLGPLIIAGVMRLTWPFFEYNPVSPYFLAVVFCSWYGGLGPGLLSLVISFLITDFFFIEPYFHFWVSARPNAVGLVIFAVVGPFICVISELMHRDRRRAVANLETARLGEESVRQSEQHLRSVLDNLFAFVGDLLPDGTLIEANRRLLEAAGISFAEVNGKKFWDCYWWSYDPQAQARVREACERAATGEVSRFDIAARIAGGVLMPMDFMLAPMCGDNGEITHLIPSAIDLTKRRQAQSELVESKAHLRAILDAEPECVKLMAADGSLIDMNPAGLTMIEADSLEQVQGGNVCERVLPEHRYAFMETNRRVFAGESAMLEFEITGIKGTRRWLEMHATPFRNKDGAIIAALGITRDVTERRKADEALRENMSKLKSIFSTAPMGIGVAADRTLIEVNEYMCRMLGYSRAELVGQEACFLYPTDEEYKLSGREYRQLNRGGKVSMESRYRCKDGGIIDVAITAAQMSPDNPAAGVVFAVTDITERKHAEAALRESEARYRILFEHAPDGISITDSNTNFVDANASLCRMLGYTRDELVGRHASTIVVESEVPRIAGTLESLKSSPVHHEEWQFRRKDASVFTADLTMTMMPDGNLMGMVRDFTERRQAVESMRSKNEELTAMTQQLWQASKLATMGELSASIAHELNNPLATVALRTENLLLQLPADSEQRKPLEVITQEVDRMATLVNNLLQFSRRSHRQVTTLDPRDEIANSVEFVHYHLRNRKIEVTREFTDLLPTIQADRQQLRQLFLNLLTNAGDAMPEGGKLVVRAAAARLNDAEAVAIEFADSGEGITAENLKKIWEPFFTTKPEGKGTGLGLAICRRIVEEHKGTISIESEPGRGTTVRITLPATNEGRGEL